MRTIKFAFAFLVAAIIAVVCVANGEAVSVRLWPDLTAYGLPASPSWSPPMFVILLLAGFAGFLIGAAREWLREGRVRSTARQAQREAEKLRAKIDELTADGDDDIPALPGR